MEYRKLGGSGLVVSALGLGTNNFGTRLSQPESNQIVNSALDLGITFFDTADIYGSGKSEEFLGSALGPRRRDVVIATKVGNPTNPDGTGGGGSRRWLTKAVESSLKRLGTDWIDLYQLHIPDRNTPIAETLEALAGLVRDGKVRDVGTSNFAGWELIDADWVARTSNWPRPASAQYVWNLLERELEPNILPAIRHLDIGLLAARPLAYGFLTGKFAAGASVEGARLPGSKRANDILTPGNFEQLAQLTAFATACGHSILELALGYLLTEIQVGSVLVSASTTLQLEENVNATGWRLTSEELETLSKIQPPTPSGQPNR